GNSVGIGIFSYNPYGILIQDEMIAEGYRKQFEILWNHAKETQESKTKKMKNSITKNNNNTGD
ncbi:MAG: hypothetical protein QW594_02375, partial [Candidatus Woesearchaeota archaeon]